MLRRRLSQSLVPAGVWLLACACGPSVATPMPEPPAFDLTGVNKSEIEPANKPADPDALVLTGIEGTVPGGAVVRVTNLDSTAPVSAVNATPGGHFEVVLVVLDGQELRFEWQQGDQGSAPADAIIHRPNPAGTAYQVVPSPRFDCLQLAPGFVLDLGTSPQATLHVQNGCTEAVSLANPRTRLGLADFTLSTALPLEIAAGTSGELSVEFAAGAAGQREDVLFVDVSNAGTTIRYPITLRAP